MKLYGTLRPDVFRAIQQAAQRDKIPVVGHINWQVGALEVLKSSQVLAAHLEDLMFARFDHPPSDTELDEFSNAIAASQITVTPNLSVNPVNIAQIRDLGSVLESTDAGCCLLRHFRSGCPRTTEMTGTTLHARSNG
jgi:hypothetical protein